MPLAIDNQTLSNLLHSLYGAATTSNTNKFFLTQLKELLNLQHATLITRPPTATDSGLIYTSGNEADVAMDGTEEGAYASLYAQDPLVNLSLDTVVTIEDLMPRTQLLESEYYQLILEPLGIYYIAGIDWLYQQSSRMSIRFVREKEQGPFSDEERAFFELLIPHLHQSVSLGIQLRQLDAERQIYADTISKRSIGMVTLDRNGNILQLNTTAKQYLQDHDGLMQVQNQIRIDNTGLNDNLQDHIQQALDDVHGKPRDIVRAPVHAIAVPRGSGKPDYQLVIKPLPVDQKDASKVTPYLTVFIQDPDKNLEISVRMLMDLYRLTLSEATIAILLAEGHTTDGVAEELGVRKNTVRAHLRSVFAKTGVTQQSMLVSLVLTGLASTQ
ncbi:helix-turn-helix transcriptional regulator [Pseudomaricurvus alkylphenolicus]|uniref:helix-turn-helix transcriptional regulator n=1 Tax=Pseudomaricurvus alkylphenolicus TaxID=1306991 RepID=UPI00141EE31B|nr:helix-turn-helix transcriptional regulator [Pseudomaricurvus alkylphenolicus]NIB41036.1 helix-turn-helix transcriptional regulator [Pseudomaricurvus alkylphenolicus]